MSGFITDIPARNLFRAFIVSYGLKDSDEEAFHYVAGGPNHKVRLPHLTRYGIGLKNFSESRCICEISIDGHPIGKFVLLAKEETVIKRSSTDPSSLIFISANSSIGKRLRPKGHSISDGIVEIIFHPEDYVLKEDLYRAVNVPSGYLESGFQGLKVEPDYSHNSKVSTEIYDSLDSGGFTAYHGNSGQDLLPTKGFATKGCHVFLFNLVQGDPISNTVFTGTQDDIGASF